MPIYKVRGIDIDFPFEAYDCQIVYMEKVIQSLQEGCNALLESPTGTGKTLCLLCATLAWRKSFGNFLTTADQLKISSSGSQRTDEEKSWFSGSQNADEEKSWFSGSQQSQHPGSQPTEHPHSKYPVIIYTSRTHSQLKQVIRELRASNYRPKMSVLGSREQMCIHEEVRLLQGRAQNNACHYLCKKRLCKHNNKTSDYMKKDQQIGNEPFDIEDLVNIGRTKGPCPYYVSRELHKAVDILFAPYNYLIDPGNRRSLSGINWSNAVLIFDEAHNLEGICADAASFDLPSGYLTSCISEAKQCVDLCLTRRSIDKSSDKQHDPDNYAILRALLLKLEKRVAELTIGSGEMGYTRPGHYIYEFLSDLNITYETANMLIDTIDNASLLLEEGDTTGNGASVKTKGTICRLESIRDILNIIFKNGGKDHAKFYRFHVQEHKPIMMDSSKGKVSRTLSWWCFNPGLAMQEFIKLGVRSIILTSGTLSPLDSFALELNLDFPIRLENPHVISPNQVWVGVVPSGPSGYSFNSSYRTRDSLEYKQELGNAIVNFARIVPDGLLVFFPSYYLMDQCIDCWKRMSHASSANFTTIWDRICKNKQPVVEPKQSVLFQHVIEDFEVKLRDNATSGAIFFAVCRGKVSEGLDFADQAGRAVIITGMPFSMKTDPKVRLKREYLDQQSVSQKIESKTLQVLTGEEWYVQQAARAVNQAVGRVIRHRHDYGAIILCDERFGQQNRQCQMSYWLRPYIKCYPKFGDVVFTLTRFFRDKTSYCEVKPKLAENISSEKSRSAKEKVLSSKSLPSLASTSESSSRNQLKSVVSETRSSYSNLLGNILPANRSNLANMHKFSLSTQIFQDDSSSPNRLTTCGRNKNGDYRQNDEVYDLTTDTSSYGWARDGDVTVPCSVKRPKTQNMGNDIMKHQEDASLPPQSSIATNSGNCYKQISQIPSFEHAEVRNYDRNSGRQHAQSTPVIISKGGTTIENIVSEQTPGDKEDLSHGNAAIKGSAFLMQVKEKLSAEEYKAFVGYLKALKSKALKITTVLESIARLFSAPERFLLLKGFKDFVPSQYRPLYEQLFRAHETADDSRFFYELK